VRQRSGLFGVLVVGLVLAIIAPFMGAGLFWRLGTKSSWTLKTGRLLKFLGSSILRLQGGPPAKRIE